ncbi:MAG: hypothetical protein AAFN70_00810 [Planctomycetota bacterium]
MFRILAPDTAGVQVRGMLQRTVDAHYGAGVVEIGAVRWQPGDGFQMRDIAIYDPLVQEPGQRVRVAHIDRVLLHGQTQASALLGKDAPFVSTGTQIIDAVLDVWQSDDGTYPLQRLLPFPAAGKPCPKITLQNCTLRLHPSRGDVQRWQQQAQDLAGALRGGGLRRSSGTSRSTLAPLTLENINGVVHRDETGNARFVVSAGGRDLGRLTIQGTHIDCKTSMHIIASDLQTNDAVLRRLPAAIAAKLLPLRGLSLESDVEARVVRMPDGELDYRSVMRVHRGSFRRADVPLDIQQIAGIIHLTPRGMRIEQSQVQIDGATCRVKGTTDALRWPCNIDLQFSGDNVRLSSRLAAMLPAAQQSQWSAIQPSGWMHVRHAELRCRVQQSSGTPYSQKLAHAVVGSPNGGVVRQVSALSRGQARSHQPTHAQAKWSVPSADVMLSGVDVRLKPFPYPIQQSVGLVQVRDGRVVASDIHARIGGRHLTCDFDLPINQRVDPRRSILMSVDGPLAIDETLLSALTQRGDQTSRLEGFVRSLAPRGAVHCSRVLIQTDASGRRTSEIDLSIEGGQLRYKKFPYALGSLRGEIQFRGDTVNGDQTFIRNFVGLNDNGGVVQCNGTFHAQRGTHLVFNGRRLRLDDSLRAALPQEARQAWNSLSPSGVLDVIDVDMKITPGVSRPRLQITARQNLETRPTEASAVPIVHIKPASLPYRFDIDQGTVTYDGQNVQIHGLRGSHGSTRLATDGQCSRGASGQWILRMNVLPGSRLHTDADLVESLPQELRGAMRRLAVRGPVGIAGQTSISLPSAANPDSVIGWDVSLQLEGNRIGDAGPVHDIRGEIAIRGQRDQRGIAAIGSVAIDSMHVYDQQITGIQGPFVINNQRLLLGSSGERIRGTMYNGNAEIDGWLQMNNGQFHVNLGIDGANVPTLLADFGQKGSDLNGRVSGTLQLEGMLGVPRLLSGRGRAQLSDARIYELPLIVQLFNLVRIEANKDAAFTDGDVEFTLDGEDIQFQQIQLWGSTLKLHGWGSLDRKRQLNLTFNSTVSPRNTWSHVIRPLGGNRYTLMTIYVKGPLDAPTVERRALDAVGQTLDRLLRR